ncbi:hypothetical protein FR762_15325 [Enterobacter sp. E76]|nr:hypothetical protein FR762_15325 [Enterobacter sp. E76]
MIVRLGMLFAKEVKNFPKDDKEKIFNFIKYVQQNGLSGLEGRNKCSDCVDKNDPQFITKVRYAVENNLWHYHIGIVEYDLSYPHGDRTSEYVLHYVNNNVIPEIKLVDFSGHPPFKLPLQSYLN